MTDAKPVHSLVLDAGPIIKNEPAVSTLLQRAETLYSTPAIISEIKDAAARSRVATTLQPFLTLRRPSPASIKIIADFAKRTGDFSVLSKNDIDIIALTYELECERNQGNWRLRSAPGQKRLNGRPPGPSLDTAGQDLSLEKEVLNPVGKEANAEQPAIDPSSLPISSLNLEDVSGHSSSGISTPQTRSESQVTEHAVEHREANELVSAGRPSEELVTLSTEDDASTSDCEGWITPSNLKRHQAKDGNSSVSDAPEQTVLQAAVLTTDFAMQNVILQMNLNLLSSSLQRVKHLKTFVLRCHACFQVTKDMSRQFCPRCGGPTLTRVSCSTNANGEFKLHLKKNMQWNHRGERYSIPKPMHGSANGRNRGGGKNGWGHDLILAEDQKEYERAAFVDRKQKEKSLMDEDYLPSILTGDRSKGGGRIKVGAGKSVNSRKR